MSKNIAVVVLGDVGRSPRMQYHCQSLIENGFKVSLVGYKGEKCIDSIHNSENVTPYYIPVFFSSYTKSLFIVFGPLKVIFQIIYLFFILLFQIPRPTHILVQNPPRFIYIYVSVPTLCICWLVCRLRGSKFIIDWHNLGYTILALSRGVTSLFVMLYLKIEKFFGSLSDFNFCVSKEFKKWLLDNWKIDSIVLYDKPPSTFHKSTEEEVHKLLKGLEKDIQDFRSPKNETIATIIKESGIKFKENRPFLMITCTSWTPDEDFTLLLKSFHELDEPAIMFITGKGPLKEKYKEKMARMNLKNIKIYLLWLSSEDYPILLGSCDLGISLHYSSSGIDLPMKAVDMLGSGLPVVSYKYETISELIKEGENGLLFTNSKELTQHLYSCIYSKENDNILDRLQLGVAKYKEIKWEDNWNSNALEVFIK